MVKSAQFRFIRPTIFMINALEKILNVIKKNKTEILLLFLLFLLNFVWFFTLGGKTLMGDDLVNWFTFFQKKTFVDAIFLNIDFEKYRPVYNLLQYVTFNLFGPNFKVFMFFNIFLNFLIVCLFFKIIKLVTRNNQFIAFSASILFITTRFSYYNLLQIIGSLEALSLLWFLSIIFCLLKAYKTNKNIWIYLMLIFNFLLLFTHERFMVLIPVLFIALMGLNRITLSKRMYFSLLLILPLVINYALKTLFFKINFLEGTSGTTITPSITTISKFMIDGILNIVGFIRGPRYLSGVSFADLSLLSQALSFLMFLVLLLFFFKALRQLTNSERKERKNIIFLLSFFAITEFFLLLSASITIRQEFRWLFAPYIVFLVFISYLFSVTPIKRVIKYILLVIFIVSSIFVNLEYRGKLDLVYFTSSQKWADSFYDQTIRSGFTPDKYKILVLEFPSYIWVLRPTLYFKQFYQDKNYEIEFVKSINTYPPQEGRKIFELMADGTFKPLK